MRRLIIALVATATVASAAPAAGAKTTCSVPEEPAWHSCLTARHVALANGNVMLTRATPALVIRLDHPCPAHLGRRTVVLRTKQGKRLAKQRVSGHCRKDVARFRVDLRPAVELPSGTVVRTFWSGIADSKIAPSLKLGD